MQRVLLAISIVGNIVFASLWITSARFQPDQSPPPASLDAPKGSLAVAATSVRAKSEREAPSTPLQFRWSQVAAADDAEFIRNLRAAQCPEQTIHDLVSAELGHRFDKKRDEVTASRAKGEIDAVGAEKQIADLWEEQNALLAQLFGVPAAFGSKGRVVSVRTSAPGGGSSVVKLSPPTSFVDPMPLALREPDESWALTPGQIAMWQTVADNFVKSIGGPNQDPKDPAYRARWEEALQEANDRMRAQFGSELMDQWQLKARGLPIQQ